MQITKRVVLLWALMLQYMAEPDCSIPNCKQCWSSSQCQSCQDGFYLASQGQCSECAEIDPECVSCSQDGNCLRCEQGYVLGGGAQCGRCSLQETVSAEGTTCIACTTIHPQCERCSNATTCTSCGYGFMVNIASPCHDCMSTQLSPQACLSCSIFLPGCQACTTTQHCTECAPQYMLQAQSSTCTQCVVGYLQNEAGDGCVPCASIHQHCAICNSRQSCQNCIIGYEEVDGVCVSCRGSDRACARCTGGVCRECQEGYALIAGRCEGIPVCTQGACQDGTGQLMECGGGCKQCSQSSVCERCVLGYYLKEGVCEKCQSRCSACTQEECTDCFTGYYLQEGQCRLCGENCVSCAGEACTTCELGHYVVEGQCEECSPSCQMCTSQYCQKCVAGYGMVEGTCVQCLMGCTICDGRDIRLCQACSLGFYLEGGICRKCSEGCSSCEDSKTCSACSRGYIMEQSTQTCHKSCMFPCSTCQFDQPTQCLSCFGGYQYVEKNNSCVLDILCNEDGSCHHCPRAFYLDQKDTCSSCDIQNCNFCVQKYSKVECVKCRSMYFVQEGVCVDCPKNCEECLDSSYCFTCSEGFFEEFDTAGQRTGRCLSCSSEAFCAQCANSASECTKCQDGFQFLELKCVPIYRIGFLFQFNVTIDQIVGNIKVFQDSLLEVLGCSVWGEEMVSISCINQKLLTLEGEISIPPSKDNYTEIFDKIVSILEKTQELGGSLPILSSKFTRIGFSPEEEQQEANPSDEYLSLVSIIIIISILLLITISVVVAVFVKNSILKSETSSVPDQTTQKGGSETSDKMKISENL